MLKWGFVQNFMKRRIERSTPGPSEQRRQRQRLLRLGRGAQRRRQAKQRLALTAPNGYDLTVTASLGIVEHLLGQAQRAAGGYFTPSQLMGADYVLKLPGVRLIEAA